jgi:dTDP-4-dehydrorhamnose reductase
MKSILITGSEGQLGKSIMQAALNFKQFSLKGIDVTDLDLTNESDVISFFNRNCFDYIINCAAFTAVDLAETSQDKAFAINAGVPAMLEKVCQQQSGKLIHISTDYVYDGNSSVPHTEEEKTGPDSVYAHSKLEGEMALVNSPVSLIIRTSWLYSEYGNNFLKTMIRLSGERKEIGVVFDQTGTPTYAGDLAHAILEIIAFSELNGFTGGIFNFSNEGVCSFYDFAVEIMKYTGSSCRVNPLRTFEYPLPAKRPAFSVLDKTKIKRKFDLQIPYWRDSLKIAIDNLRNHQSR